MEVFIVIVLLGFGIFYSLRPWLIKFKVVPTEKAVEETRGKYCSDEEFKRLREEYYKMIDEKPWTLD